MVFGWSSSSETYSDLVVQFIHVDVVLIFNGFFNVVLLYVAELRCRLLQLWSRHLAKRIYPSDEASWVFLSLGWGPNRGGGS